MNTTNLSASDNSPENLTEEIVANGTNIQDRLTTLITQSYGNPNYPSQFKEGLVSFVRSIVRGAKEGLDKSAMKDREGTLRQVLDALGDGLSKIALAGQLTIQEASSAAKKYTKEDLSRLTSDLTTIHSLFKETVLQGLKTSKTLTQDEITNAGKHAGRVADSLGPVVVQILDAVRQHPAELARESVHVGLSVGQSATGALFQSLGQILQNIGDRLRQNPDVKDH